MRRIWHIAVKDVLVWVRDTAALGILLGMPIVLILILGSALSGAGTSSQTQVAVVNLDTGVTTPVPGGPPSSSRGVTVNRGQELVDTLSGAKRLADVFDVEIAESERVARERVAGGEVAAALIVPRDFSRKMSAGEPVALIVLKDPGAETAAGIFESVVRSFAARYSAASVMVQTAIEATARYRPELIADDRATGALVEAAVAASQERAPGAVTVTDTEATVTKEMTALDFYGVSMTAMFLMFGAMFGAFSTIKERRERTLSRLLSAPVGGVTVTLGKMLGIFMLGMMQFVVLYGFTRLGFRVDWGGDPLATFAVAAAEVLAVTGMAVFIAAFAQTERGAGALGPILIQIQALLGGAFFTITALPEWMQSVRFISVIGWAIEGWQEIQIRGGGLVDVLPAVGAMMGFALLFFVAGAWKTGVRA